MGQFTRNGLPYVSACVPLVSARGSGETANIPDVSAWAPRCCGTKKGRDGYSGRRTRESHAKAPRRNAHAKARQDGTRFRHETELLICCGTVPFWGKSSRDRQEKPAQTGRLAGEGCKFRVLSGMRCHEEFLALDAPHKRPESVQGFGRGDKIPQPGNFF